MTRRDLVQAAVLSHADNELWSAAASDLLNRRENVHLLLVRQLVDDVIGAAEQATLLYAITEHKQNIIHHHRLCAFYIRIKREILKL